MDEYTNHTNSKLSVEDSPSAFFVVLTVFISVGFALPLYILSQVKVA